jgi:hypothetical protein
MSRSVNTGRMYVRNRLEREHKKDVKAEKDDREAYSLALQKDPLHDHTCAVCHEQSEMRDCITETKIGPYFAALLEVVGEIPSEVDNFLKPLLLRPASVGTIEADGDGNPISVVLTVCRCCDRRLKRGECPPRAVNNNLTIGVTDLQSDTLQILKLLTWEELQLISLIRPVMGMKQYRPSYAYRNPSNPEYTTGQWYTAGTQFCVTNPVCTIATALPRSISDSEIMYVVYRNSRCTPPFVQESVIRPNLLQRSLELLFRDNDLYIARRESEVGCVLHYARLDEMRAEGGVDIPTLDVPDDGSSPVDPSSNATEDATATVPFFDDHCVYYPDPVQSVDAANADVLEMLTARHQAAASNRTGGYTQVGVHWDPLAGCMN